jgi:molecular chaperone DnaK
MSYVFGIDLGTTFSAISYIDEFQKPILITNTENTLTTPSAVCFKSDGSYVVGAVAEAESITDPANVVRFVKREMGKGKTYTFYGEDYTPQKISAFILMKLKRDAETYFRQQKGEDVEVKDVVITVPAYFGMQQKSATKEAGELAGFNVLMILNEPTAAAIAYTLNRKRENQTVFVFDLGGGTFDVNILEINGNNIKILASDGDNLLGGKDWDNALVEYCSSIYKNKYGIDPQDDPKDYAYLYERIIVAKKTLSHSLFARIPVIIENKPTEIVEISREKFEALTAAYLEECKYKCADVLKKAVKKWSDIDTILMVGGSTYMPMVIKMIRDISCKEPSTGVNPDQCVAIGAAYQAKYRFVEDEVLRIQEIHGDQAADKARIQLMQTLPDIKIYECVSHSLGTDVLAENGMIGISEIIPEQSPIPTTKEEYYTYSSDDQTSLTSLITEGKGEYLEYVTTVGEVILDNLPPRKKGASIKVIYTINRDKTLDVQVIDVETGQKGVGKVALCHGLSADDLAIGRISVANKKLG